MSDTRDRIDSALDRLATEAAQCSSADHRERVQKQVDAIRGEVNEVYAAERDEARSARYGLTELERADHCPHKPGRGGSCVYCGETIDP